MSVKSSAFLDFAARRRKTLRRNTQAFTPPLQDRSPDILAEMPSRAKLGGPDIGLWLQAAAVLACFNPLRLRAEAGGGPPPPDLLADLTAASEPVQSPPGQRSLTLAARRTAMQKLGTRAAMRQALAFNPAPDVPVQAGLAALLEGPSAIAAAINQQDAATLTGVVEAMPWVEGILPDLPDRADLLATLARMRLAQPLVDLVGNHFSGRQDVLAALRLQLEDPKVADEILFLSGPGGAGKSTVLAKFALDLRRSGISELIVYLNFDRPTLRVEEPLTALREIILQLAAQTKRDDLFEVAQGIDAYILRFAAGRVALESISDGGGGWEEMIGSVAQSIGTLPGTDPILVLVDTFERAQRRGASLVHDFTRMMTTLSKSAPRLRFFAAGRVDAFGMFPNLIPLEGLGAPAVGELLAAICDEPMPQAVVDAVLKLTGGKPLTVRLAALLIRRAGGAKAMADPDKMAETLLRLQSEKAEAVLYNRLLGQIEDGTVRSLARKGLLLRRITPGIIRHVLIPALSLKLDTGAEYDLFERYRQIVDLAELGIADWGEPMLTHRAEVRTEILPELRDGAPGALATLDRTAIDYFAGLPGPMARAEEIYHRLFAGEDADKIAARWLPEVGPHLIDALEEVGPAAQVWLANRIGVDIPDAVRAQAEGKAWEDHALRTASYFLNRGDPVAALGTLHERNERQPASPLFLLEADALSRLGRAAEMDRVLAAGLASAAAAGSGARRVTAELRLARAFSLERRRRFARAANDAAAAHAIAREADDASLTLQAVAVLLRLHRKARGLPGPRPSALAAEAMALLDRQGDESLVTRPALMRALAGELGPLRPSLLAEAHRHTGDYSFKDLAPAAQKIVQRCIGLITDLSTLTDVVNRVIGPWKGNRLRVYAITELVQAAVERGQMDNVAGPVAMMLAAETDQLSGAFPPPHLQGRRPSWWPRASSSSVAALP